jgi:integrase
MARGRPPLRIGAHGTITRTYLGGGIWLARCRFRDSDGVVRKVEKRGPPDEFDKYGKLAKDELLEALADRRPPSGPDAIGLDTLVVTLVDQHIARLAEDGRSIRTLDCYKYDATKLAKFVAGVRVGECTPARLDAALRSMRTAHGPTMARRARTLLRGGLQLAVLNNVLTTNPVRDVQSIRSKGQPKGATALTVDQLRELLTKVRESEVCQRRDLVDPITLLVATGLRRSELLGLRWVDFDDAAGTLAVTGEVVRQRGTGLVRVDETKTDAGRRPPHPRLTRLRDHGPARAPPPSIPRRARGDLPVDHCDAARPRQLRRAVAGGALRTWGAGRQHAQLPQDDRHPHR